MRFLIKRLRQDVRQLPESLRQDVGNPTQQDRLPDSSAVELEFPIVAGSLAENRRTAAWFVVGGFALVVLMGLGVVFDRFEYAPYILGGVASYGLLAFLQGYFEACPSKFKWLCYIVVLPHAVFILVLLREPFVSMTVAAVCLLLMSDLFASHFFHLQTTAPMERQRALQFRDLWRRRFGFTRAARGLELYIIEFLGPMFALAMLIVWALQVPPSFSIDNLPRVVVVLLAIAALPWIVEHVAAFVYARRALPLSKAWRQFWPAVVQWLTYNKRHIKTPGTYQTPAGSCRARRRMSYGLLLITAAFAIPVFNLRDDFRKVYSERLHRQSAAIDAKREKERQEEEKGTLQLPADPPLISTADDGLEPYQERMMARMNPEERAAYLEQLRKARVPPVEDTGWEPSYFETDLMRLFAWLISFYTFMSNLGYPIASGLAATFLVLSFCYCTSARMLAAFSDNADLDPRSLFSSDRWDELVARVRDSKDFVESQSLLLGVNADDNSPVLVPRDVFAEHAHLLGDSGSGKTSIGIASIMSQLIRFGDCSVVVLDLKGDDMALFAGAQTEAEAAGLPFKWFTNQLEHPTYVFNPLQQEYLDRLTLYQKTDMLTAAMGLQYGRDYGRAYYADANAQFLQKVFEVDAVESFRGMADLINDPRGVSVSAQLRKDASHVQSIVCRLADCYPLNVTGDNLDVPNEVAEQAIQFIDVFRKPQLTYFHLSSTIGTTSSAEIARMALYSLLASAANVPATERVQTFVFIDEFQRIVSGNVELLLQLARSLNIGIILANQTLMDLRTGGVNLIPSISANTRFKQVFAASYLDEQEELTRGSGESLVHSQSWHEFIGVGGPMIDGRNMSEMITPRLRANDVLLATDHPLQSIVQIRRGDGYAQYGGMPFVMRSSHHISLTEYNERKRAKWPEANDATVVPEKEDRYGPADEEDATPFLPDPKPAPPEGQRRPDPLLELYEEQQKQQRKRAKSSRDREQGPSDDD